MQEETELILKTIDVLIKDEEMKPKDFHDNEYNEGFHIGFLDSLKHLKNIIQTKTYSNFID